MSRSYKKAISKVRFSGRQDGSRRHRRERRAVSQIISKYGNEACQHLPSEKKFKCQVKSNAERPSSILYAVNAARIVNHVLDNQSLYVIDKKGYFEFISKYDCHWCESDQNVDLGSWFPIAQRD